MQNCCKNAAALEQNHSCGLGVVAPKPGVTLRKHERNVANGHSKNQGPSALGTKPCSIRNKNAHTHHSVFQNWGLERDHKTKQP